MDKDILDELKKISNKLDRVIDCLKDNQASSLPKNRTNEPSFSRGDDIRRQVQEQIAQARREIGSKANMVNFNLPIGNLE